MPLIHDIKFDGTWHHVSYWSKHLNRRVQLGRFGSHAEAERVRRDAVKRDGKLL